MRTSPALLSVPNKPVPLEPEGYQVLSDNGMFDWLQLRSGKFRLHAPNLDPEKIIEFDRGVSGIPLQLVIPATAIPVMLEIDCFPDEFKKRIPPERHNSPFPTIIFAGTIYVEISTGKKYVRTMAYFPAQKHPIQKAHMETFMKNIEDGLSYEDRIAIYLD